MVPGFDTDVERDGRVFRVRTSERGHGIPLLESRVYSGDEVVTVVTLSYADILDTPGFSQAVVVRRMRVQHQDLIREIRSGVFDAFALPEPVESVSGSADESLADLERILDAGTDHEPRAADGLDPRTREVVRKLDRLLTQIQHVREAGAATGNDPGRKRAAPERPAAPTAAAPRAQAAAVARRADDAVTGPVRPARNVAAVAARRRPRGRAWRWVVALLALLALVPAVWWLRPVDEEVVTAHREPATEIATAPAPAPDPPAPIEAPETAVVVEPEPIVEPRPRPEPTVRENVAAPPPPPPPIVRRLEPARVEPPVEPPVETPVEPPTETPPPAPSAKVPVEPAPEPEPRVWAGKLVDLDDVDLPPRPRKRDLPRYSRRARRLKQEGVVELELLVAEDGSVVEVEIVRRIPDSDLDRVAVDTVRQWTFSPARKDGFPVRVRKPVQFEFSFTTGNRTAVRVMD